MASSANRGEELPLVDEQLIDLTRRYAGQSPASVALLASRFPSLPMARVARQLKGRQVALSKLPSWAERDEIAYPSSLSLEQCSSETAARYKASLVPQGRIGVDLTGGFGVDARFLAERFERFVYIEKDSELVQLAKWNLTVFGLGQRVTCRAGEAASAVSNLPDAVDFIYVDPARRDRRGLKVSALGECEPDLTLLWPELRRRARRVMAKLSPGLDLSVAFAQLPSVEAAHVVSVDNECKELLLISGPEMGLEPEIHCVDLGAGGSSTFCFSLGSEAATAPDYAAPGRYLYEPNAAIMKAGGFKTLGRRYKLGALGPRTRLYSSNDVLPEFPGRIFEVFGSGALSAREAKRLFSDRRANVISRNSGLTADALRIKLGLRDGGDLFAIGASLANGDRQLFACRRIAGAKTRNAD